MRTKFKAKGKFKAKRQKVFIFFFLLQCDMVSVSSTQESDPSSIRTAQFSGLLNAD